MDTLQLAASAKEQGSSSSLGCSLIKSCVQGLVESEKFWHFSILTTIANLLVIAGATDHPDDPYWTWASDFLLLILAVELLLRALCGVPANAGKAPRGALWKLYMLDAFVVAVGTLEFGVRVAVLDSSHSTVGKLLSLLNLVRILRLGNLVQRLQALLKAFTDMLEAIGLIFAVLVVLVLVPAIVCTSLLGPSSKADVKDHALHDGVPATEDFFRDTPTSFWSLFMVVTLDNWIAVATPAIALDGRWTFFFVAFIAMTAWTMISVLTAVASDGMVAATSNREAEELREQEENRQKFLQFLRSSFVEADVNGDGFMDYEEFQDLIKAESVHETIRKLGLNITISELEQAWSSTDVQATGMLTIDEFVNGLGFLQEDLATKHVANVDYSHKRLSESVIARAKELELEVQALAEMCKRLRRDFRAREVLYEEQSGALYAWREWVGGELKDPLPTEVLEKIREAEEAAQLASQKPKARHAVRAVYKKQLPGGRNATSSDNIFAVQAWAARRLQEQRTLAPGATR